MTSARIAWRIALATACTAATLTCAVPASAEPTPEQGLSAVNNARAQYNARPLTWNDALHPATEQDAKSCKFARSRDDGRNLYVTADPQGGIYDAVASWTREGRLYNYANPVFSEAAGNFTQLVWKSTTQVSVAVAKCPAGTILPVAPVFVVARFTPPGNVEGQFKQNVGRHA